MLDDPASRRGLSSPVPAGAAGACAAPAVADPAGATDVAAASRAAATRAVTIVGSPELDPETSGASELGVQLAQDAWRASVTVFRNDLKDMIDITSRTANREQAPGFPNFVGFLPDGRPIFRYQNIARVRTVGVESSLRAQLGAGVGAQANYTYLDSTNRSGTTPVPLAYQPSHSGNVTLDWQGTGRLGAYVTVQYFGHQYTFVPASGVNMSEVDGFATVDLGANVRLTPTLLLRGGLLNAADRRLDRTVSDDFNADGRRFFLSLAARF